MTYIIAGATGTTGSSIARELSKSNKIHLIGRNAEKLSTLADEIGATYSTLDLNNPMPTKEYSQSIEIDEVAGLINCIGSIHLKPLHGSTIDDFNDVINTNLFSSYYLR